MEFGIPVHRDKEVNQALTRLLDALCTWERETGRRSVLILREDDYCCRAQDGKCVIPIDIPDSLILKPFQKTEKHFGEGI
jgi:hypothetical protein